MRIRIITALALAASVLLASGCAPQQSREELIQRHAAIGIPVGDVGAKADLTYDELLDYFNERAINQGIAMAEPQKFLDFCDFMANNTPEERQQWFMEASDGQWNPVREMAFIDTCIEALPYLANS